MTESQNTVSDDELKRVIADFLDQGHVDNIIAMFRHEPRYYGWTGEILRDPRLSVRLGISVLFEELRNVEPERLDLAFPSLVELLSAEEPMLRGEAISLLGIIGSDRAMARVRQQHDDPSPRVREMVQLVLADTP